MSTIDAIPTRAAARSGSGRALLKTIADHVSLWARARRTRLHLLDLSEHELKDLGLTREAARQEALRPFWDNGSRLKGRI